MRVERRGRGDERRGEERRGEERTGEDRRGQERTEQEKTGQYRTGKERSAYLGLARYIEKIRNGAVFRKFRHISDRRDRIRRIILLAHLHNCGLAFCLAFAKFRDIFGPPKFRRNRIRRNILLAHFHDCGLTGLVFCPAFAKFRYIFS